MTDEQYADLIEYLERKFEEMWLRHLLLQEETREEIREMTRRLEGRIDGVARRLDAAESRRGVGGSWWRGRMPQA